MGLDVPASPRQQGEGDSDTGRAWAGGCGAALLPSPLVWEEEGARALVVALLLAWEVQLGGQGSYWQGVFCHVLELAGSDGPCLKLCAQFARSAEEQLLRVVSLGSAESGEHFPSQFLPPAHKESWNHRII